MHKFAANLGVRVERQRAFHAGKEPGDLLVYVNRDRSASLEAHLCARLGERPAHEVLAPKSVIDSIGVYARKLGESLAKVYEYDDDCVPCAIVYWGIGGITAAMTGREPTHDGTTSWLEANLGWDEIAKLRFDPGNRWIQFALDINRALWDCWQQDFFILPYLHRSPLDAANGIRGSDLFLEMYTEPEQVKKLVGWCADWSIQLEDFIAANAPRPMGWGNGVWSTWLPDRAVFINGDPVGMISHDMHAQFEKPYTERLFTATGGGFFHNHTMGLYQALNVAATRGLLVQEFICDPKHPNLPEVMLKDPKMRDEIIRASLLAPIMVENIHASQLDQLLPLFKKGRFILSVYCEQRGQESAIVRKVRSAGNIR